MAVLVNPPAFFHNIYESGSFYDLTNGVSCFTKSCSKIGRCTTAYAGWVLVSRKFLVYFLKQVKYRLHAMSLKKHLRLKTMRCIISICCSKFSCCTPQKYVRRGIFFLIQMQQTKRACMLIFRSIIMLCRVATEALKKKKKTFASIATRSERLAQIEHHFLFFVFWLSRISPKAKDTSGRETYLGEALCYREY